MLASYGKKFFEKFIAMFVILSLVVLNFAGCGSTQDEWVKRCGKDEIKFSQFLLLTTLKVKDVETAVKRSDPNIEEFTFEDMKEGLIYGNLSLQHLKDLVEEELNNWLVIKEAARRLGVSFTDQQLKSLKKAGYEQYKSCCDVYQGHKIGISLQDCFDLIRQQGLEYKVGQEIFGEGKFAEVKDKDINDFLNNRANVVKYKAIYLPESLEGAHVEKEVQKGKNKVKEKTNELKIKKHFNVNRTKDLVQLLFNKIKNGEKSFDEIEKQLTEVFKESGLTTKEDVRFFDDRYDDELKNSYDLEGRKFEKNIKNTLKDMGKDNICRVVEGKEQFCILKTLPMDENVEEQKKEKVKDILQDRAKQKYLDKVRDDIKKKIETNNSKFKQSIVDKQVKKVYRYRREQSQFPTMGGI